MDQEFEERRTVEEELEEVGVVDVDGEMEEVRGRWRNGGSGVVDGVVEEVKW